MSTKYKQILSDYEYSGVFSDADSRYLLTDFQPDSMKFIVKLGLHLYPYQL